MRALVFLAVIALTIYTAVECSQSPAYRRAGGPRWLWMILIIVVPIVGPLLWIAVSRSVRRPVAAAPDDDPDFLRYLADQMRHQSETDSGADDDKGGKGSGTAGA